MAASWEMLRAFVDKQEWSSVVDTMLENLSFDSPFDLLPLLNGALNEVIRKEDDTESARQKRIAGRSVFSQLQKQKQEKDGEEGGDGEASKPTQQQQQPQQEEAGVLSSRRWRRTLRAMFAADAAVSLQNELLAQYGSEEFVYEAGKLNERMADPNMTREAKKEYIDKLSMDLVQSKVIPHYGFTADKKGWTEVSNILEDLIKSSKEVRKMTGKINKTIIDLFPNLR